MGAGRLFCAASLLVSLAQAQPFSHRIHLGLKLGCITCHSSAPASTKVSDNNLPKPEICVGCHKDGARSIKAPRQTNVAKFSHAQHMKFGATIAPAIAKALDTKAYLSPPGPPRAQLDTKNPCTACHRGLETSTVVSKANFPEMADCLVCHNKIDNPFSCTTCHANDAQLKPVTHTPDFLDRHTSGKAIADRTQCAVCHGRTFTCLGCHQGG